MKLIILIRNVLCAFLRLGLLPQQSAEMIFHFIAFLGKISDCENDILLSNNTNFYLYDLHSCCVGMQAARH